jgi:hypothetical protein
MAYGVILKHLQADKITWGVIVLFWGAQNGTTAIFILGLIWGLKAWAIKG